MLGVGILGFLFVRGSGNKGDGWLPDFSKGIACFLWQYEPMAF